MQAWQLGVAAIAGLFLAHGYWAWNEGKIMVRWGLYLTGGCASCAGAAVALRLPPLRGAPMVVAVCCATAALLLYRRAVPAIVARFRSWGGFRMKSVTTDQPFALKKRQQPHAKTEVRHARTVQIPAAGAALRRGVDTRRDSVEREIVPR